MAVVDEEKVEKVEAAGDDKPERASEGRPGGLAGVLGWPGRKLAEGRAFFSEVRSELKKVTWPSRKEVYSTTHRRDRHLDPLRLLPLGAGSRVLAGHVPGAREVTDVTTGTTTKLWYIVHTYSGFEKKVSESLRQRAKAYDLEDQIGRIEIPTEEVVEMKAGRKVQTATRFFPGYILVEIETEDGADGKKIPDATWHLVRNTPKVTGFVGSGNRPVPLSQEEADQIFNQVKESIEKPKPKYTFERGENVRIIDGPFSNFQGVVEEVNLDRNTLKVMVTIFGRSTPVELDFLQVEKL